jgi:hypothetical protein
MGKALTEAMRSGIKVKEPTKKGGKLFAKAKPFDWGSNTEKTSSQVDDILYDNA